MQVRIQQLAPGMVQQIQSVCHDCQGQGERINPKDRCKTCQGRKIVRERKILEVHIDKGLYILEVMLFNQASFVALWSVLSKKKKAQLTNFDNL